MGGITIRRAGGDPDQPEDGALAADRRLYLDAGGTRVLEDGDPAAAFLLAAPGRAIPKADVARLGLVLVEGSVQQEPIVKQAAQPENKMVGLSELEDKGQVGALDSALRDALDAARALDTIDAPASVVQTGTGAPPAQGEPPPPTE